MEEDKKSDKEEFQKDDNTAEIEKIVSTDGNSFV